MISLSCKPRYGTDVEAPFSSARSGSWLLFGLISASISARSFNNISAVSTLSIYHTFATDLGKRAKVCFSRPIAAWLNAPEMDIRLPKLPSCLKN